MFKNDRFDVTAKDASTQVYRLARVVFTKQDAKMISETFEAITDVGKRKEMFAGLWGNIAEIRGLNLTEAGQKLTSLQKEQLVKGLVLMRLATQPSEQSPLTLIQLWQHLV
jgi:hypothetical protein